MNFANVGRWSARTLKTLGLVSALFGTGTLARAQTPAPPASPTLRKEFTKDGKFKLPIRINPNAQDKVREVVLYVKTQGGPWLRHESVPANVPNFTYESKEDGEFFFQLVTVDQEGKSAPSDINKVPPALHVIVDTKAPTLEGQYGHIDGEPCVRCVMSDNHPDQQSVKAYAVSPAGDRLLAPVGKQPNVYRLEGNDVHSTVRIEGSDLAGNKATKVLPSLKSLQNGGPATVASAPTPPPPPVLPVEAPPVVRDTPPPFAPPALAQNTPPMPPASMPPTPPTPPAPPLVPPTIVEAPTVPPPPVASRMPAPPIDNGATQVSTFPSESSTTNAHYRVESQPGAARTVGNRKLLGTRRATIDYRIDAVGPSGVGKVEIFATPDGGQTWVALGEDIDKKSPAEVDLPGEGVYGVRLVITNNHGFGGKAPVRGDQPHVVVDVDMTAPTVQVRPAEMVPQQASIDIRWTAQDNRQLSDEPISIYYRGRADGNWQPIARNIKNDGQYRWNLPRDVPPQLFLKVEATDLVGNIGRAESTPISLDIQVPNVEVINVVGGRN